MSRQKKQRLISTFIAALEDITTHSRQPTHRSPRLGAPFQGKHAARVVFLHCVALHHREVPAARATTFSRRFSSRGRRRTCLSVIPLDTPQTALARWFAFRYDGKVSRVQLSAPALPLWASAVRPGVRSRGFTGQPRLEYGPVRRVILAVVNRRHRPLRLCVF